MTKNILIDFVQVVFNLEIANPYTTTEHTVIIDFPDRTQAVIAAHPVAGHFPRRPVLPPLRKDHSYHYVHQHDFGYGRDPEVVELNKLTLRGLEDCRVYLQDACENLLAATFNDFEVTFDSGPVYLLTITPLLKRSRRQSQHHTKPHSAKRSNPPKSRT